jgi:hypothetical protein
MCIRDLREYIKKLCGTYDIEKLGRDDEPFFKYVNGAGRIVKKVISSVADFASNAEEQLFYEFVQNAYDANSDSLMFFANEKYLIVLNNGLPFYTDQDVHARDGELFSFLAKGASDKNSDDALGYYGQGSKLLYSLITDTGLANTRELLYNSIYEQQKGPYVISWDDTVQLNNFLLDEADWEYNDFDNEKENILICKVVDSYFPVIPGISDEYFSDTEYHDVVNAFNELVDPRRNLNLLRQGTAMIIPLGKGQYEKISNEDNLKKVRTRLGGFSSLTSDKEYNKGKHINHIFVFGEEVAQHEVKSIIVDTNIEGETIRYHFAFNPIFAEDGYVNFFKGLPILQAKYNLGFIIDSQAFQLDNSRQRINDFDKTKLQLMLAFNGLLKKIEDLKSTKSDAFGYVYKSLLATNIPEGEDYDFIREPFESVFNPFFKDNVFTGSNDYVKLENARIGSYSQIINLREIGINDKKWADSATAKLYKTHKIKIESYPISNIIEDSDKAKLSSFLLRMHESEYEQFSDKFRLESVQNFPDVAIYRSNKGKMYTFNQVIGTDPIFYFTKETPSLKSIYLGFEALEYIITPVSETENNFWSHIYQKVKEKTYLFTVSDAGKECCCGILKMLTTYSPSIYQSTVRSIELFPNMLGMRMPFKYILSDRPKNTCILDKFMLKGYKPESLDIKWLCSSDDQKWELLVSNFKFIKNYSDWNSEASQYIKDIKTIYNNSSAKQGNISLYLTKEGVPTDTEEHYLKGSDRLTNDEYNKVALHFKECNFVPYNFMADLSRKPFAMTSLDLRDILDNGEKVSLKLLSLLLKVDPYLLNYSYIKNKDGQFSIFRLDGGKNFIGSDLNADASTLKMLSENDYHQIPDNVVRILDNDEINEYRFPYNKELVDDITSRCQDKTLLFPIIRICNDDTKANYFNNILTSINISSTVDEDDVVWDILKYASTNEEYRDSVLSAIRFNGKSLPDTIKARKVTCRDKEYDVYDLIDDYKEDNSLIESFLKLLPDGEWFRSCYYNDKEESISSEDIYGELPYDDLSLVQLEFSLNYVYENDVDLEDNRLTASDSVSLKSTLEMVGNNDFPDVDRFLDINGFDKSVQVKAPKELLLEEEIMPSEVQEWLSYPKSFGKITGYYNELSDHIRLRQAIHDGISYAGTYDKIVSDSDVLARTISWLLANTEEFSYGSSTFDTLKCFIESIPEDVELEQIPVIEFNGRLKDEMALMRLSSYDDTKDFINVDNNEFLQRLATSTKLQSFVQNHHVVYYQTTDWFEKHGIKAAGKKWSVSNSAQVKKTYREWDDPIYKLWKEKEGLTIFTSPYKIGTDFLIQRNKDTIFQEQIKERSFGYDYIKKFIVVNFPNSGNDKLLTLLAKVSEYAPFFTQPFVRLQQMFLEDYQDIQAEAEKHNLDIKKVVKEAINAKKTGTNEQPGEGEKEPANNEGDVNLGLDQETKKKLENNKDAVKDIVKSYSEDELKKLAENPDDIKSKLEEIEEEEDPESQVRQTIGYIGELIYKYYLQDKLHKDTEFAADEGKGEYDFKYDDIYVDVKTNLYSFKGSTVPFYLHISQSKFLQEHPDSKYRIVRISLKDLELEEEYLRIRSLFGVNTNPRENERLKKECDKIARKYWRKANIDEFNSLSPEYSIKLEVKNKKHA